MLQWTTNALDNSRYSD